MSAFHLRREADLSLAEPSTLSEKVNYKGDKSSDSDSQMKITLFLKKVSGRSSHVLLLSSSTIKRSDCLLLRLDCKLQQMELLARLTGLKGNAWIPHGRPDWLCHAVPGSSLPLGLSFPRGQRWWDSMVQVLSCAKKWQWEANLWDGAAHPYAGRNLQNLGS